MGFAILLDLIFGQHAQVLRILSLDKQTLDHTIYIHDLDSDSTKRLGFLFRVTRFVNDRVLLEAKIFNDQKEHIGTFVQQCLIYLKSLTNDEKLLSK